MEYLLGGQNKTMQAIDIFVQNYFSLTRASSLTEYMYICSYFFDVSAYSIIMVVLISYLIYLVRGVKYALLFLFSLSITAGLVYVLKIYFDIARPTDAVMSAFGQSFPSYHATIAVVFFVMLMYVFDDYLKPVFRIIFNSLCIFLIYMVAFSRIYLGVHWFSDVAGGILLGGLISYISVLVFRKSTASL